MSVANEGEKREIPFSPVLDNNAKIKLGGVVALGWGTPNYDAVG